MTPDPLLARAFDMDAAHLVFFAVDPDDLPAADVADEMEVVAALCRAGQTRSPVQDLLRDVGANLAGEAAWTGLLATLGATSAYLRRRSRQARAPLDAAAVMQRVRAASREITGVEPIHPADVDIRRDPDGTWHAELRLPTGDVTADLDASGTVLLFRRTSTGT
ncbi:hypothetical protein [Dactylosporangium matsuzakiense]|uniref:Uncharacterized protein n=1 Tax=Dactylosporangium matsuzakiense TaxID=53360 RepID=A0A9W6KU84_9ACTN|nr:hypothetical protein [Dactylosporangium matsuzakiense]GLL07763.1 hypothetical protein GCM10017581_095200 [Dactylosporangium matsuzakiense]